MTTRGVTMTTRGVTMTTRLVLLPAVLSALCWAQEGMVQVAVATEKGPTNTGHCTCQVYAGWSEMKEYYTLKKLNMRIGRAEAIMDEMNFTTIFDTLENATARLTVLEDNINKQAVAASVTELFALRKNVENLVNLLEAANGSREVVDQGGRIGAELEEVRQSADNLWARNPYKQRNEYHKEVTRLRDRLASCHHSADLSPFPGDELPINTATHKKWCSGRGTFKVGSPVTHRWDASNSLKRGMWLKDPQPLTNSSRTEIWKVTYGPSNKRVYSSNTYSYIFYTEIRKFPNYSSLISHTGSRLVTQSYTMVGYGAVLYRNFLYFNNERYLVKLDLVTMARTQVEMAFREVYYRGSSIYNFVDIKVDESGLWVLYTKTADNKLTISKIDPETLLIEKTWKTDVLKTNVCAAFMMCGKMYTVYSCGSRIAPTVQNYVYDTRTSTGSFVRYHVPSMYGSISQLTYNSRERVLFGWDQGHLVTYPLSWESE